MDYWACEEAQWADPVIKLIRIISNKYNFKKNIKSNNRMRGEWCRAYRPPLLELMIYRHNMNVAKQRKALCLKNLGRNGWNFNSMEGDRIFLNLLLQAAIWSQRTPKLSRERRTAVKPENKNCGFLRFFHGIITHFLCLRPSRIPNLLPDFLRSASSGRTGESFSGAIQRLVFCRKLI